MERDQISDPTLVRLPEDPGYVYTIDLTKKQFMVRGVGGITFIGQHYQEAEHELMLHANRYGPAKLFTIKPDYVGEAAKRWRATRIIRLPAPVYRCPMCYAIKCICYHGESDAGRRVAPAGVR